MIVGVLLLGASVAVVPLNGVTAWTINSTVVGTTERVGSRSTETRRTRFDAQLQSVGARRLLRITLSDPPTGASQIQIDFEVDASLHPTRVANWDALRSRALTEIEASDMPQQIAAIARARLAPENADSWTRSLTPELAILATGQRTAGDQPPTGDVWVRTDRSGEPVRIHWERRIPAQTLSAATRDRFLAETGSAPASEIPEGRQTCDFDLDRHTGLVTLAECDFVIGLSSNGKGAIRREHWTITQTPLDKR